MPGLSSTPVLNPEIKALFSGSGAAFSGFASEKISTTRPITLVLIFVALIVIGAFIFYFKKTSTLETPQNIQRVTKNFVKSQDFYAISNPKRKDLRTYLTAEMQQKGISASNMALTNFYVSTVNATGIFFPAEDGVASPEAAKIAVLAGARAFVFDIWPDIRPGAQFAPSIQVIESGSNWRRITLNSMQFVSVIRGLVEEAFELDGRPGKGDPVFFYLRFRGVPRPTTFNQTADALRTIIEKYRLDASYYNRRAADSIFSQPITQFFRKIIVCSNVIADGTALADYINVGPRDGYKQEWQPSEPLGLSEENKKVEIPKVKQMLSWVAPLSETADAEANYNFQHAMDIGVHFCAMNFWNPNSALKEYMKPENFGVYSYKLKPLALRHVIERLPDARYPDPSLNVGSGSVSTPAAIARPF